VQEELERNMCAKSLEKRIVIVADTLEGTEMPAKPAALDVRTGSNSTFIVVRVPVYLFLE
jgi:hypothetical protein